MNTLTQLIVSIEFLQLANYPLEWEHPPSSHWSKAQKEAANVQRRMMIWAEYHPWVQFLENLQISHHTFHVLVNMFL